MASEVDVANAALTKVGDWQIAALTEDTPQARTLNLRYATLRDAELAAYAWTFATTRTELAADATAPAFEWARAYTMPSDCLRVLEVGPPPFLPDTWTIEGRKILTDIAAPMRLRYVRRVTDVNAWDALFFEVLACRLAVEIAERLTQSTSKRQIAQGEYRAALAAARRADAFALPARALQEDGWLLARLGGV